MKNIFVYLLIVLAIMVVWPGGLGQVGAAAEPLLIPSPVEDDPDLPQLELPEIPSSVQEDSENQVFDQHTETYLEPIQAGEPVLSEVFPKDDGHTLFDFGQPALLESSGTWLRRGYWFTEVDAVILHRGFDRNILKLMSQEMAFDIDLLPIPEFGRDIALTITRRNDLFIGGSQPGSEGMPRIKIGRFLFRDSTNRDHTAEFTWYGGGQWSQQSSLNVVEGIILTNPVTQQPFLSNLDVPERLSHANPAFNGATSSQVIYESRFNTFELNYHLKRRLQHDQMVMRPDGEWVRKANPTWTRSFLTGIRYFDLTENLDWDATDVPEAPPILIGFDGQGDPILSETGETVDGNYRVRTDNDMFGLQIGLSQTYERARWSAGLLAKIGGFVNHVNLDSSFSGTNNTGNVGTDTRTSGTTSSEDTTIAFLSEVSLRGKWHLRPNLSLRAGFELMLIDSIALAPYQMNFIPGGYSPIITSNSSLYMGGSVGFEGYW